MSEPIPIIAGTAGHVDHGKTSLVAALTNFETDRHPEEKSRGMSIDFSVAPFVLSDGRTCGLLDVPGHEDFIKNMVSGASSVNLILLVVAADDGIMPQTREHLQISLHLGASLVVPVISKIDLVSKDEYQETGQEVLELIATYGLKTQKQSPNYVSSITSEGISELREDLEKAILSFNIQKNSETRAFRMFVRTCFPSKGHGDIVTGIPSSGSIKTGDKIELISDQLRNNKEGIVKNIQNYRSSRNQTRSNISSALNIRGIDSLHFIRGSTIVSPGIFKSTKNVMAWIKNTSEDEIIKKGAQYQVHVGTFKCSARIIPVIGNAISPGEEKPVLLKLEKSGVLVSGDRFLLRSDLTIGGGRVLSFNGKLLKRVLREYQNDNCIKANSILEKNSDCLRSELIANMDYLLSESLLSRLSQEKFNEKHNSSLEEEKDILKAGTSVWINLYHKDIFIDNIFRIISDFHAKNPKLPGMKILQLAQEFGVENLIDSQLSKVLDNRFRMENGVISLANFGLNLNKKEQEIVDKIKSALDKEGYTPKATLKEDLKLTDQDLKKYLKILESTGEVKSVEKQILKSSFLSSLKELIRTSEMASREFTLSEFRKLTGLSRNIAVVILEMFDSEGFTKRLGNSRKVV